MIGYNVDIKMIGLGYGEGRGKSRGNLLYFIKK